MATAPTMPAADTDNAAQACAVDAACFHCGEAIPAGVDIAIRHDGRTRAVCCHGCAAAAEWIGRLGLGDYYRLRSEPAQRNAADTDYTAWDRPALTRLHVRRTAADRAEVVVLVDGLRCAACAWLIERALGTLAGVHEVGVNAAARRVQLGFDPSRVQLSQLLDALARLGYAPHPLTAEALDSLRQRESRTALKRLVVAGLGAMQAMMYAVALYAGVFEGIDPAVRDFFRWVGFLVATPVVLYSAQPFFTGALREWRARRLSMDTPVAIAIAPIYAASLYETLRGGHEIYFDSVSMFVFFLLIGRTLEMRARHRAGDVVDALARLQPALAERRVRSGDAAAFETVGVHELEAGDLVRVAAGATIPADGVLADASCRIDESLLSGESKPLLRRRGEAVVAGSLALDGPVLVEVQRIGADTVLAGIVRMVTRSAGERPRLARMADARAARFVVRVLVITSLVAVAWLHFDPSRAFSAALAVLVVSCPCAFALAVPTALTRAVAVLARRGVLVVEADALEALATADCFVFDKTGTLTEPRLDRTRSHAMRGQLDDALRIAAALEQASQHPLARAMRAAAGDDLPLAGNLRETPGAGVEGEIGGVCYRFGLATFSKRTTSTGAACEDDATPALVLADDAGEIARFAVDEAPRPGAVQMLAALREAGIDTEILSGDAAPRVAAMAARLGVERWQAGARPAAKLARLATLRAEGRRVAMVGDGVNDAPVLAAADVALAIGDGASLAHAASGILLGGSRLGTLVEARAIAQQTQRTLRQNLNWALAYNLSVVPLAALGFVPPWLAAIGMSASSIVVILNSLRIGRGTGNVMAAAPGEEATT
ncbi:MAG TPA: heavy metal translocating P-type ATPase [Dokdonella sp.]|uniref:heavy metal translocating P-type ATPase n=1 Tax=Dokdonella sp. TaxID=2291710 RepID=UPI0025BD0311|nr:heavy metal translocating P-type ATPase [Dokdonella sp.]MBX3692685.1 cadmium-translocating P-type ATPase [Dokdonella sp.]HNR92643.1 heavy metal translocating P-type ATPase [Dokdonella sp.]